MGINSNRYIHVAIGEGKIEVGIPFTDKSMVFNNRDLTELKELLAQ